uniref:Pribosyltran_N domain-containing protein n=1 Tax=Trichuris muris TaxID=70415 RepID=A0A5S6QPZ0_TRIMR
MEEKEKRGMAVLVGGSHPELASLILSQLPVRQCEARVFLQSCRETFVDIRESIRNREIFIIQTATQNVNSDIMELLIMIYTCKTSSARSVTVVMPYFPYTRHMKLRKRSPIVSKLLANMIKRAGANRMITLDLCRREVHGFFSIPLDNVPASSCIVQHIRENVPNYKNAVMVAKSPTVVRKATSLADKLGVGVAIFHDSKEGADMETSLKGHGNSEDSSALTENMSLILCGDVGGRIGILVDDVMDEVEEFIQAAVVLRKRGAYKVIVVATHGIFTQSAPLLLEDSMIDEIFVTNTVPHEMQKIQCPKIKTIDVSPILSEAIRRTFNQESLSRFNSETGAYD